MKLYIKENQHTTSILHELFSIEETDIELIFPEKTDFFAEEENLDLLKKQAALLQKHISIVSPSGICVELAKNHGISASKPGGKQPPKIEEPFFEEVETGLGADTPAVEEFTKRYFDLGPPKGQEEETPPEKPEEQQVPLHREPSPPSQKPLDKEPETLFKDLEDYTKKEPLTQEFHTASKKAGKAAAYKVVGAIIVLAILGFLYIYLPQASVEVFAKREKFTFVLDVTAKKDIASLDSEARVIPAERLQIRKELSEAFTVQTKGSFAEKAKGEITVFNKNAAEQFMIPSRFQSKNGNIYWSQRNIRIPARGSLQIEVIAANVGSEFNLECSEEKPCEFSIPAWKGTDNFTTVFGKGTNPIGGGVAGEGFIVTKEDFQKAEVALRSKLVEEAQKELSSKIPQDFKLIEDTIRSEVLEISSEPALNGLTKDGKATMRGAARVEAFLIREADLKQLVDVIVKAQIDEGKETKPESVTIEYSTTGVNLETSEVTLHLSASEDVAVLLDTEDMMRKLAGKSESQVRDILSQTPNVQSAEVTLWPFWARRIPERIERIEISVK